MMVLLTLHGLILLTRGQEGPRDDANQFFLLPGRVNGSCGWTEEIHGATPRQRHLVAPPEQ